ncbi:hypothetical protein DL768_004546 [Monosporascus sp. mg162]|nr:hypothetical protein DL768_004546 [Monosporascus sp. mg162]
MIDEQVVTWENQDSQPKQATVRDNEDIAYLIFTSGSTGKPKGVMISHGALATSAVSHGNALLMDNRSRVLQFASYAFDAAVLEHITSLIMGACICIPSDTERHNIPKSVAGFEANWVLLTPAVARALDPSDFKTIRTLVIGGEAITEKELNAWCTRVNLLLAYGPAECTIISYARHVNEEISDGRTLGRCIGGSGWVVSPDDSNQLVPVGAVGELLIEGPIVGLGYLNDPEKTADAFIDPPPWLVELRGNSARHIYKSGDLVRYTDNGEIRFVGRKDLQVKLRGNRIELGEVESHLRASFPGIRDAVAEIVKPEGGDREAMLVAFVYSSDCESQAEEAMMPDHTPEALFGKPCPDFSRRVQLMEAQMSKSLPAYMIPVVYLPLRYLPLTGSGKLDRKKLRAMAALLSPQQLEQYDTPTNSNEMPTTTNELLLQQVWARVLNKDLESVDLHSNFFRIGGDSIAAMQVVSQCSAAGITVTVADIFRYKTISQLSSVLQKSVASNYAPERSIDAEQLGSALHEVVQRHSMLRARFSQNQHGEWRQTITSNVSTSYRYQQHAIGTIDSTDPILSESQLAIDLQRGPIMVADLITVAGSEQYLFIAAHHLVTDLVSWRIILGGLENYLSEGSMPLAAPLSFQTWCTLQREYAAANLDPEHARLDTQLPQPPNDYWGMDGKSNLVKDSLHAGFTLKKCNIIDVITRTKDKLRTVPSNGWAHFPSSLHPKAQDSFKSRDLKEVTFNFVGAYQQLERSDSLFQMTPRPSTSVSDVSQELCRFSVIDVVVELKDNCLQFRFHFNKHAAGYRPILAWITNYSLAQHGIQTTNVEDVYPSSPIQRGILLSQAKEAHHYQTHIIWKMKSSKESSVHIDRVIAAWRRIVARHPIFRTVFVDSISQDGFVDQVVLKNITADVIVMAPDEEKNLLLTLSEQTEFAVGNGKLPYRFSIGQTLAGDVLCGLEISHALYDGITKQNILHELQCGYWGTLPLCAGPSYSDYISYLGKQSAALHGEYWTNYLHGVTPCHFPASSANEKQPTENTLQSIEIDVGDSSMLRRFCEVYNLTISNICQVAWGIVLKSYVNSENVCFGYLSAGRDVPIPHAQEAMGPFINMLVCRMDISESKPVMEMLQDNQNSFVDSLKHQHYPLANILHAAELPSGGSLFNTAMSLQNIKVVDTGDQSSLQIEVIGGRDPSEVNINPSIPQNAYSAR